MRFYFIAQTHDNTQFYSVQFEPKESIHLVIDPPNGDMRVQCGLLAEGKAKMWDVKDKEITCAKCLIEEVGDDGVQLE